MTASRLRVLLLVQDKQRIDLDSLYDAIAENSDCDIRRMSRDEQARLRKYFSSAVDVSAYDRIILFLRSKLVRRQAGFVRTIPNLVFLEHDACQNYMDCKYQGAFSRLYHKMPWARVLCSGYGVSRKLQQEGIDAVFVSKGYDQTLLRDLGRPRDIELGFIGTLDSRMYDLRRSMLERIAETEGLKILRTEAGEEYLQTLNRIRFFVSADVGIGEYMIKNFEAMACGCILITWDQGEEENRIIGFRDMENVVLYRSREMLQEKLARLRREPELANGIRLAGMRLVSEHYRFRDVGARVVEALRPPLRTMPSRRRCLWWGRGAAI